MRNCWIIAASLLGRRWGRGSRSQSQLQFRSPHERSDMRDHCPRVSLRSPGLRVLFPVTLSLLWSVIQIGANDLTMQSPRPDRIRKLLADLIAFDTVSDRS